MVLLPLFKKRPVLIRGPEAIAMWAAAVIAAGLWQPWLFALLLVQAILAWVLRPWLVVGISRDQVVASAVKAGSMIRLPVTVQSPRAITLSASGNLNVVTLVPGVHLITLRARRSKKIALFRNVIRKTLQNLHWGVR